MNYFRKIGDLVTMEEVVRKTGVEDIEEKTIVQRPDPIEYVGDIATHVTYERVSEIYPFRYAGHCLNESRVNFDPKEAIREFVCSPWRTDNIEDCHFYIDLAKIICRNITMNGRIPVAPHLYFPQFLNDDRKKERAWGLAAGLCLLEACSEMTVVVIDGYISEGMQQEIWHAIYDLGITPHYIRLTRSMADTMIEAIREKE